MALPSHIGECFVAQYLKRGAKVEVKADADR